MNGFDDTVGVLHGQGSVVNLGNLTINAQTLPLYNEFTGAISGSGTITVSGFFYEVFANASNYTGGTTIENGKLIVKNTSGSATGSGPVAVNGGGVLAGTGNIDGVVSVNENGTLRPGTLTIHWDGSQFVTTQNTGTITVDTLNLNSGSILAYELGPVAASDKIVIANAGGLMINAGTLNVTALNGFGYGSYPLLDYSTSFSGSPANLALGTMPAGFTYGLVNNASNTSIELQVTVLGDYNLNGIVDAADYVVRRKNDGTLDGFNNWRANCRNGCRRFEPFHGSRAS